MPESVDVFSCFLLGVERILEFVSIRPAFSYALTSVTIWIIIAPSSQYYHL